MLKKYKAFSLLFLILLVFHFIAVFFSVSILHISINICFLLILMVFFVTKTKLHGRFHKRLFTGLLFALAGSLLLLFTGRFLTLSFICNLLGYVFYTRAFYLDFRSAQELDKNNARIAIAFCTLFGMGLYVFLRPYLGIMKIPVMIYVFISCMMLMMAVFRNLRVNRESFILIFAGALLLLLSDSLLVINKFVATFPFAGVLITTIYMTAQYLIIIGGVERKLLNK
ncbi:putative membrane protein YhhN [Pedobacter sp. CG_S7]|uniref:lysoplasmalogenase n=1 Tax=Pedobacter sp. CG_S7 TaxID=3143930 RepID=UPI0033968749